MNNHDWFEFERQLDELYKKQHVENLQVLSTVNELHVKFDGIHTELQKIYNRIDEKLKRIADAIETMLSG